MIYDTLLPMQAIQLELPLQERNQSVQLVYRGSFPTGTAQLPKLTMASLKSTYDRLKAGSLVYQNRLFYSGY